MTNETPCGEGYMHEDESPAELSPLGSSIKRVQGVATDAQHEVADLYAAAAARLLREAFPTSARVIFTAEQVSDDDSWSVQVFAVEDADGNVLWFHPEYLTYKQPAELTPGQQMFLRATEAGDSRIMTAAWVLLSDEHRANPDQWDETGVTEWLQDAVTEVYNYFPTSRVDANGRFDEMDIEVALTSAWLSEDLPGERSISIPDITPEQVRKLEKLLEVPPGILSIIRPLVLYAGHQPAFSMDAVANYLRHLRVAYDDERSVRHSPLHR
jgi:hypothetical protein